MSLSAIAFLDLKGKILLSRDYRGDVNVELAGEQFLSLLGQADDERKEPVSPVIYCDGLSYIYIRHNNLYGIKI